MRAEEWEEIKRIFEAALDLTGSKRESYLDSVCGKRPSLRRTVDELLAAHHDAGGFLDAGEQDLPPVFQPGDLVAQRFRIVRFISRGGMGEVYETFDERLSVLLALKTLRPEFASDADALERFRREIRVTRDFSHSNLCRIYELVEHPLPTANLGDPPRVVTCLTMQLMSGGTLKNYIEKHGKLSPETALPLIQQIAGAVATLHENDIIHRDLKPSNIMIAPTNSEGELRAIVMDFGLTKPIAANRELFESNSDFQAGAPFFLAPELVAGERPSISSDIYALGLIIDEMVTGGGAFEGPTIEAILYQKLWGEPKDPQLRAPDLPAHWVAVIRRCLNRNPAVRYRVCQEVVRALSAPSLETVPLPNFYQPLKKADRWPRTRTVPPRQRFLGMRNVLLACAILLVAGLGALAMRGSRSLDTSVLTFDFENLTGKPEYEYLAKGMTREFERRLLTVSGLNVLSYHRSRPKDSSVNTKAHFMVDGEVEASTRSPRLSIAVTDRATGQLICCSDSFQNDAADPLQMQAQIATAAVQAIRAAIIVPKPDETLQFWPTAILLMRRVPLTFLVRTPLFSPVQNVAQGPTVSATAMQLYMRARELSDLRTLKSLRQSIALYQQTLREDPKFALAYAALAEAEHHLLQYNLLPRAVLLQDARAHALKAVQLGPDLAESYAILAVIDQDGWDWQAAEADYQHALQRNAKLGYIHRWYGGLLIQFGKFDSGLKEVRTAIDLDPYDDPKAESNRLLMATYLHYANRPDEASTIVAKYLTERDSSLAHTILGYIDAQLALNAKGSDRKIYLQRGLAEAARIAGNESSSLKPEFAGEAVPLYALLYALGGQKQLAQKYLNLLLRGDKAGAVDCIDLAAPYVALGDLPSALKMLTRAANARDSALLYLRVDPFLEPLRSTSAFQALLKQVGLV